MPGATIDNTPNGAALDLSNFAQRDIGMASASLAGSGVSVIFDVCSEDFARGADPLIEATCTGPTGKFTLRGHVEINQQEGGRQLSFSEMNGAALPAGNVLAELLRSEVQLDQVRVHTGIPTPDGGKIFDFVTRFDSRGNRNYAHDPIDVLRSCEGRKVDIEYVFDGEEKSMRGELLSADAKVIKMRSIDGNKKELEVGGITITAINAIQFHMRWAERHPKEAGFINANFADGMAVQIQPKVGPALTGQFVQAGTVAAHSYICIQTEQGLTALYLDQVNEVATQHYAQGADQTLWVERLSRPGGREYATPTTCDSTRLWTAPRE